VPGESLRVAASAPGILTASRVTGVMDVMGIEAAHGVVNLETINRNHDNNRRYRRPRASSGTLPNWRSV